MTHNTRAFRAMILGLEYDLAHTLTAVLARRGVCARCYTPGADGDYRHVLLQFRPDVVFCSVDEGAYSTVIQHVHTSLPGLPVVVVGRFADARDWLNAIEAGAWDYCVPPIESRAIGWILDKTPQYSYETEAFLN